MTFRRTRLLSTFGTLLLAGCGQAPDSRALYGVETEVRDMLERYCEDVRVNGLRAEISYIDSSRDFFWVPPGFTGLIGFDSVSRILRENAGKMMIVDNRIEKLLVLPQTRDLAVYSAKIRSRVITRSGDSAVNALLETGVVRRVNGKWKLLCGQTSVAPLAEQIDRK